MLGIVRPMRRGRMNSLKFGTSGLRGLVSELDGWPSFAYTTAFLKSVADATRKGDDILIGRDLRQSSPRIAAMVAAASRLAGFNAVDCGALPTPALALEAVRRKVCAIMITGSHIPENRNGLKFYKPDGEINKDDENHINNALSGVDRSSFPPASGHGKFDGTVMHRYLQRYIDAFSPNILRGQKIVVYQQSSVARDIVVQILEALGASVKAVGRSESFVPIDTEAHRPADISFICQAMSTGEFDALVTTDGDADRPLVADANGRIVRGDILGLITSQYLNIDVVVVPVTASSSLENHSGSLKVLRTKVGSPYVIEGMALVKESNLKRVAGFEANGGFLLASDIDIEGRFLSALPTRDAMLPILATLATVARSSTPLSQLVGDLEMGEAASNRLSDVAPQESLKFLHQITLEDYQKKFFQPIGVVQAVNTQDGVRAIFDEGRTIHFRASGNAPELRCYAEARSIAEAEALVQWGLAAASASLNM